MLSIRKRILLDILNNPVKGVRKYQVPLPAEDVVKIRTYLRRYLKDQGDIEHRFSTEKVEEGDKFGTLYVFKTLTV